MSLWSHKCCEGLSHVVHNGFFFLEHIYILFLELSFKHLLKCLYNSHCVDCFLWVKFQLYCLIPTCPWASYLNSLSHSPPICKTGMILIPNHSAMVSMSSSHTPPTAHCCVYELPARREKAQEGEPRCFSGRVLGRAVWGDVREASRLTLIWCCQR